MAQQFAAILAGIAAQAIHHHARPGLVATLHALILSALARLLSRLDTILTLRQAGQLPADAHTTRHPGRPSPGAGPDQGRRPALALRHHGHQREHSEGRDADAARGTA